MNWKLIPKDTTPKPTNGSCYSDWKQEIAEEGFHQCVYCSISEKAFGGIRNFHIEHYKPKSKFPELRDEFSNLFYSCSICNCFKGNDWPNEPTKDLSSISYPKPSKINYKNLFVVNTKDGRIDGKNIAASYMIEKLFLNRPQLILERKHQIIFDKIWSSLDIINEQKKELYNRISTKQEEVVTFLKAIDSLVKQILDLIKVSENVSPYKLSQIKR
ncbi:MAG: HNH endonuclease [Candidatus Delongbacteria bacterium]|nr:HNH endonuclease [Candidatus Delongbacteria bacterium]